MLVRVIVGVICALFAIGLLVAIGYGYGAYVSIVIALFSALCVHEIMGVSQCKNRFMTRVNMIFAACVPLYIGFDLERIIKVSPGIITGIYVLAVLIILLKCYDYTKFENAAMGLFASIAIPVSASCLTLTYEFMDKYPSIYSKSSEVFVILTAMFCAWLCDTFALFSGMALGKHKLAPNISPKKTVEGAIGGVVGTTISSLISWAIFNKWFFHFDTIKWWMVLIFVPVICVMGMCGDLAASVIKRNFGVKDYGTLFPEHGGAMDRIDSFLFSMPATYIIVRLMTEALVK